MNNRTVSVLLLPLVVVSLWAPSRAARAGSIDCSLSDTKDRWVNALGPVEPAAGNEPISVFMVTSGGGTSDVCNLDPLNFGANCCSTANWSNGMSFRAANQQAVEAAIQSAVVNWNRVAAEAKPFFYVRDDVFADDEFLTLENAQSNTSAVYVSSACMTGSNTLPCSLPNCDGSSVGEDFKIRIRLGSRACGHEWTTLPDKDADSNPIVENPDDIYGTLVHELGHALGLQHTDGTRPGCPETENSVMNPDWMTSLRQYHRVPRRADIENLRLRWSGVPERDILLAEKSYFQSAAINATGLTWNLLSTAPALRTNTPPVTTNAHDDQSWYTVIGFTNTSDRVSYTTGEFGVGYNFDSPVVTFPPNNTIAVTFDGVAVNWGAPLDAVSHSETRVMTAWYDGENNIDWGFRQRWAIRNFGSTTHTHSGFIGGSGNRNPKSGLGIGVDLKGERFILVFADDDYQLSARMIDMATGSPGPTFFPGGANFSVTGIGSPSCVLNGVTTSCSIPVTAAGPPLLGPCAGWVRGTMNNGGAWVYDTTSWDPECFILDSGMRFSAAAPSLASDFRDGMFESETHLAGFASPGDDDEHIFKAADGVQDGWVLQSAISEFTARNTQGWPVSVGSNTANNQTLNYRMVSAAAQ